VQSQLPSHWRSKRLGRADALADSIVDLAIQEEAAISIIAIASALSQIIIRSSLDRAKRKTAVDEVISVVSELIQIAADGDENPRPSPATAKQ